MMLLLAYIKTTERGTAMLHLSSEVLRKETVASVQVQK